MRLGMVFAGFEIAMQVIGYETGRQAGRMLGEAAALVGFALLALIGVVILRKALKREVEKFDATSGAGLIITALSVSLDSLGVGVALPAAHIPLVPLLVLVSFTTTMFTLIGLAFGARLGERFEHRAEAAAGAILILLSIAFSIEWLA